MIFPVFLFFRSSVRRPILSPAETAPPSKHSLHEFSVNTESEEHSTTGYAALAHCIVASKRNVTKETLSIFIGHK